MIHNSRGDLNQNKKCIVNKDRKLQYHFGLPMQYNSFTSSVENQCIGVFVIPN